MKVQTEMRLYDDVEINADGSWTFRWFDSNGKAESYTFAKIYADMHSTSGAWKIIEEEQPVTYTIEELAPYYAAAFNAWQDSYLNDPSSFEDSHTTAIRHLTEKLNGEVPSYGQVAAELFQEYLNKVQEGV